MALSSGREGSKAQDWWEMVGSAFSDGLRLKNPQRGLWVCCSGA